MSKKFNAYIDGFNLYYGSLLGHPELKWLDLRTLAANLFEGAEVDKVYYFTSKSKGAFPSDQGPNRQDRYWRILAANGVEVVTGFFNTYDHHLPIATSSLSEFTAPPLRNHFGLVQKAFNTMTASIAPQKPKAFVTRRSEKASDVNLASYLLRDVYENGLTHALVITADADLITALRFARQKGVYIGLFPPRRPEDPAPRRLLDEANYIEYLKDHQLLAAQFPDEVIGLNGKEVRRPESWT
ncbi:MAG: NYN domain-containing protein [Rhodoluna sp.]|nr:NYN domain-containing protein [Rhodoluna sp.]MBP6186545.1 NYN domain-containing protein [Rhodoluna sp.]